MCRVFWTRAGSQRVSDQDAAWTILIGIIDGYDIGAIALPRRISCAPGASAASDLAGAHRKQYRRSVRFAVDGLRRRPLWPQDGADLLQRAVRRADLRGGLFDRSDELFWLRFFAGFGIGGVIPNLVAINASRRLGNCARRSRSSRSAVSLWAEPRRLRQRGARSALRLADPVSGRRCRSDHCSRWPPPSGLPEFDQVHGAHESQRPQNGKTDCRDPRPIWKCRPTPVLSSRTSNRPRPTIRSICSVTGCG